MEINLTPSPQELATYGLLAHVSPQERQRILTLPFGRAKPERKRVEAEVEKAIMSHKKTSRAYERRVDEMEDGGVRFPITQLQKDWVKSLQSVQFLPNSREKSFVDAMAAFPSITYKQGAYIKALAYKYNGKL